LAVSMCRWIVDFYTNLTFKVQKGRGLESRDQISKVWDPPYNF